MLSIFFFTLSISLFSQTGKGYVITKDKTRITCDRIELNGMQTKVGCVKGANEKKYKMNELFALAQMPKGKKAADMLLQYFGECPEAKTLLEKYKEESQTAKFAYDKFHIMVSDYNHTSCKNH